MPPTKESGKKLENAESGIKGCDAVWAYDPSAAYFGMKEWAELLLAERDALQEAHNELVIASRRLIALTEESDDLYDDVSRATIDLARAALDRPE